MRVLQYPHKPYPLSPHNTVNRSRNAIVSAGDAVPDLDCLRDHNKLDRPAGVRRPYGAGGRNHASLLIAKELRDTVAVSTECVIGVGHPA